MLQQLHSRRSLVRIAVEALLEEVDTGVAELIFRWQLWWVTLGDVVHDCPLVVHGRPRSATSSHLENDTAERPDINRAVTAGTAATDYFGRHVHRCSGHGALAALTCGVIVNSEGTTLAGDELCGAEVNEFDDTVVVKQDVCIALARGQK